MKRVLLILILLVFAGAFNETFAQRKKEVRNQRRSSSKFKRGSSGGHADAFAKGSRRGKSKKNSTWGYKHKKVGKKERKGNRFLFTRHRTKGRKYKDGILAKQNASRAKRRVRGNKVFHRRKF